MVFGLGTIVFGRGFAEGVDGKDEPDDKRWDEGFEGFAEVVRYEHENGDSEGGGNKCAHGEFELGVSVV